MTGERTSGQNNSRTFFLNFAERERACLERFFQYHLCKGSRDLLSVEYTTLLTWQSKRLLDIYVAD